jgi:hypothetical protein
VNVPLPDRSGAGKAPLPEGVVTSVRQLFAQLIEGRPLAW